MIQWLKDWWRYTYEVRMGFKELAWLCVPKRWRKRGHGGDHYR